ncbi:hypothetical protein RRG08_002035 [Elysia crispata]|uniref:Fibrinogen C-terminal domain-containing protein n=1 Tax=Elysia crispata TaxID=231223 RepID=A0AAE1DBW4_9GAST|nr:hypothetical protein RRG08_002035 [Elysia crispata]
MYGQMSLVTLEERVRGYPGDVDVTRSVSAMSAKRVQNDQNQKCIETTRMSCGFGNSGRDMKEGTIFAQYKTFNLESEANKYRIRLGDVSGSLDDGSDSSGLSFSNGMYFSTFDRDNDSHKTTNCAMHYKAGWWYKSCYGSLLNAPAPLSNGKNEWYNGKKYMKPTLTAMKIRPLQVD